jgi:hypothetical protein
MLLAVLRHISGFNSALAQTRSGEWSFSVSAGVSTPVGAFRSSDPSQSLAVDSQGQQVWAGFKKEGNAAALPGFTWGLQVERALHMRWKVGLAFTQTENEVTTDRIEQYLAESRGPLSFRSAYEIAQEPYRVSNYQLLLTRRWETNRFFGSAGLLAGLGVLQYPNYELLIVNTNTGFEAPLVHRGFKPTSKSFASGLLIDVGVRLSSHWQVSICNRYQRSDFLYEKGGRFVGSSTSFLWVDTVNYRVLTTTLNVCFRLP